MLNCPIFHKNNHFPPLLPNHSTLSPPWRRCLHLERKWTTNKMQSSNRCRNQVLLRQLRQWQFLRVSQYLKLKNYTLKLCQKRILQLVLSRILNKVESSYSKFWAKSEFILIQSQNSIRFERERWWKEKIDQSNQWQNWQRSQ